MIFTDPVPLAIWATLLLAAALSVVLLAGVDGVRDPHLPFLRRRQAERVRRRQDAEHTVRYADELAVATARATRAATAWHEHCRQSEQDAAAAWQAWQDAEHRLAEIRPAAAFTTPTARTPAEYADQERCLHRAVSAAVDRGDLPATALAEALAGHGGWLPRHPVEQECAVQRATVAHRRHLYQRAVRAEKASRHDARLAFAARDSLRQETTVAATNAGAVRHLAVGLPPGPVPQPGPAVLATA